MPDRSRIQNELESRFPGRSEQIRTLLQLLGEPSDPVVPSIFVYGQPSSGKTSIVKAVLEAALEERSMYAYINCVECHAQRILFEHALNQWCNWTPCIENGLSSVCRVDNLQQFVRIIQEGIGQGQERIELGSKETRYLVLDRAERLRDMGPTLLPTLLRLSEMTGRNVCVILISTIVFEKFRNKTGVYEPLLIRFPPYTREQVLEILMLGFRNAMTADKRVVKVQSEDNEEEEEVVELDDQVFANFCEAIYAIFNVNCKDVSELRYLATLLFPLYIEPIRKGQAKMHDASKLLKLAQPYFAQATDKLYLREISSAEWSKETQKLQSAKDTFLVQTRKRPMGEFDLPYYTKFLLLASFLASYNPPRYDVRYFAKSGEERRKKKGGGTRKSKEKDGGGGKLRPQLLGPKAFPVERMLAIFYSIIDDTLEDTIDIHMQITSLTTLRLLVRSSSMDRLDAAKYKCNVSFDFIKTVAASVHFQIEKYLYDFF